MQLAIDTSTDIIDIALFNEDNVRAEITWCCGQNHTIELLPNLIGLLHETGVELYDINGLAVATGPGSFNGLRVGMSVAKGLALVLDIPVVGISTLEIEAYSYSYVKLPICPLHRTGRGDLAAALYQMQAGTWCRLMEEHVTTSDALCSKVREETIFCGRFISHIEDQLRERLGAWAVFPVATGSMHRIGSLAELARQRLKREEFDNPTTLQPLYLHPPPITQSRLKRNIRWREEAKDAPKR
jgi:tRNA threonylcarbamoyladenosine biosynthesis protein TsaB